MTALLLTLLVPGIGALVLALIGRVNVGGILNIVICGTGFAASLQLAYEVLTTGALGGAEFFVDAFNVYLIVLTTFVGLTTAVFSRTYMSHEVQVGRITPRRMRLYFASFQGFLFTMLLALSTNNLGILWVSLEGATLVTVLLVSIYRTPESIEAAWKYFILCGVGIAQALFGTVLVYLAAAQVIPDSGQALLWTMLQQNAAKLDPGVMSIAFVFLLVGYGTKVGLVPLHNWLPDAHSEGPTPMSAVLSGLLLNVALYAIVRMKSLTEGALNAVGDGAGQITGQLMMGFGLISFIVAGLFLHRQRDIKRLFSYSSIEHMGLMTFAFGLGGPLATFGALLHMTVHSLTKSAIFVMVGHASQISGTQVMIHIRGLIRTQPAVGWSLLAGSLAIAGFPPFGVFISEFLLLTATIKSAPWLALPILSGLAIAFAGLFRHIQPMVFGDQPAGQLAIKVSLAPVLLHLLIVLWLGISIPLVLANWFDQATQLIAGTGLL
jgi:hydrogenase-4 component F